MDSPNKNHLSNNAIAFLWHALFLALAKNFMDMDVVLPAMVLDAGGNSFHVGLLMALLTGGVQLSLLIFTPFLTRTQSRKQFLLTGINVRIIMLIGLSLIFFIAPLPNNILMIWLILLLIAVFAVGGAFANIGYVDILGKSIGSDQRKLFFSIKQILSNSGVLVSAYLARFILVKYEYPQSYRLLFLGAAIFLAIASFGFWKLRESKTTPLPIRSIQDFILQIRNLLKENKKLRNYIVLLNTQGIVLVLLPFLVLYAKTHYHIDSGMIGNYLFLKVVGGVAAAILVYLFSKRVRYNNLLYIASGIAVLVPLIILSVPVQNIFPVFFLMGGIALVLHLVSVEGILLELSTSANRVFYTGLVGTANLLPGLFSLLAGSVIQLFGMKLLFGSFVLIAGSSMIFVYKLNCQK